uniref:SSD domain-containing protein n=1 Tax=Trichuris muris TaxID=70415 RepID=A0A5S6Q5A3_TRIMR
MYSAKGQCFVYVTAKDGGNIYTEEALQAIANVNSYVAEQIQVTKGDLTLKYEDVCARANNACYLNPLVQIVKAFRQSPEAANVRLTYPKMVIGNQAIYLGSTIGGVEINKSNGNILSAKAWMLVYPLKFSSEDDQYKKDLWQGEFEKRMTDYDNSLLSISVFHDNSLDNELNRNAQVLAPRLLPCFLLLLAFSALSTVQLTKRGDRVCVNMRSCSPLVAIGGVLGACLGVASSMGLTSYLGFPYNKVVAIMPFLIVSVRIDNTFLMIAALAAADRRLSVEDRIVEAISEAAVSIFLTVATDALSFGVGCVTDFPAVRIFCIYTCSAIVVTFVYQLTLLFGLLVYEARREDQAAKKVQESGTPISAIISKVVSLTKTSTAASCKEQNGVRSEGKVSNDLKNKPTEKENEEVEFFNNFFSGQYATVIMSNQARVLTALIFLLYAAASIYGCMGIRQGLEPYKLLPLGSYVATYYQNLEKYMWTYGIQMHVAVVEPGNLADYKQREKAISLVRMLAESRYGIGVEGVECWLTDYLHFLTRQMGVDVDELSSSSFHDYVMLFLNMPPTRPTEMTSFGKRKNFNDTVSQREAVAEMRRIASNNVGFNVTTFNKMWPYVDQYDAILPNIIQECGFGVMCMILLALVLIPKAVCSLWVTFAIVSVDLGVIGFMTLWGLNMDTVSMITIVMSIGFSVDFSAHIAYAYSIQTATEPVQRIRYALGQLAWPVIQGGISTMLGVLLLADLGSYMIVSFFKTVFLVITLGLLHALLFLPLLLTLTGEFSEKCRWHSCRIRKSVGSVPQDIERQETNNCDKSNNG